MRAFETFEVTDTGNYKKGFNTAEFTMKYKTNVKENPLYIMNYSNYGSIVKGPPVPTFGKSAFVRYFYEELLGVLMIMRVFISDMFGFNIKTKTLKKTDLEVRKPLLNLNSFSKYYIIA